METKGDSKAQINLDMKSAGLLAKACRSLGGLESLHLAWKAWPGFSKGPLLCLAARQWAMARGFDVDLARLLAISPENPPTRPGRGLRLAMGYMNCCLKLISLEAGTPLIPSMVGEVFTQIDAPQLARHSPAPRLGDGPVEGAAAWTLAPRWLKAGLPPLWAAGLAMAAWEREGPDHALRGITGGALLTGLAPRLGLGWEGFALTAGIMGSKTAHEAANGLRSRGAWRPFVQVFLSAVADSCQRALDLSGQAIILKADHKELIKTWVRAPNNPLALLRLLFHKPVLDLPYIAEKLEVTQRTAGLLTAKLVDQGLLAEITGQKRGRLFAYAPLLDILEPGWNGRADQEE